jgi:hypothetical protein
MVNGAFQFAPATGDLAFQRGDARVELADRQTIKVLPNQFGKGLSRTRREVVEVHGRQR